MFKLLTGTARRMGRFVAPRASMLTRRTVTESWTGTRSMSVQVPVINVEPFFKGDDGDQDRVAAELRDAAESIGFFTITGAPVDKAVLQAGWDASAEFFQLDESVKRSVEMSPEYPYGYSGFGEEALATGYGQDAVADLKECFAIGPYDPKAGMVAVRYPEGQDAIAKAWHGYYTEMEGFASGMLRLFARALRLDADYFEDKIVGHRSALRILNYPPLANKEVAAGAIRAGEHTDYGTLTILMQDGAGGLQVQDRVEKKWHDVPPHGELFETFVINIGDAMQYWTNDTWVSTPHRVVNPSDPEKLKINRQSIAFFHNLNADVMLECIPTCDTPENPAKYEPVRFWDHLMGKHLASVGQD